MTRDAHFHLHSSPVSRGKGHSAVAASAYQANQRLRHVGQQQFSLPIEFRKALNKGEVTPELEQAFQASPLFRVSHEEQQKLQEGSLSDAFKQQWEAHGYPLSDRLRLYTRKDGWTLRDNGNKQTFALTPNGEHIDIALRHGFRLSKRATIQKEGRREWTIHDGETTYTMKEFTERTTNPRTGKREVTHQGLDVYADKIHDYTRKGDVVMDWVQVPTDAPPWMVSMAEADGVTPSDRERLWNAAESAEASRTGRPARKIEMALLRELPLETNIALVRQFVSEQLTAQGLVADMAVHSKEASDGHDNTHVHILFTAREINKAGEFAKKKNEFWNQEQRIHDWRQAWSTLLNDALADAGSDTRTDHRSYESRGMDQEPGVHLGAVAWNMEEEQHVATERGRQNLKIKRGNHARDVVKSYTPATVMEYEEAPANLAQLDIVSESVANDAPARQSIAIREHLRLLAHQSLHAHSELINTIKTYARAAADKAMDFAKTTGREIFDRFASLQSVPKEREETKGHER